MFTRLVLLCVLFVPLPLLAATPAILVLGDSLSAAYGIDVRAGWVALLEQRLDQQGYHYRVVNASISGETTRGALERLPAALAEHRPAIVIIELGGNDGLRGLPLTAMRANLERIIRESRAAGARPLLVGMKMPPNYGMAFTQRFEAIYRELAQREQVALVPFLLQGVAGDAALMQSDGMHADAAAQPQLLDNVWPHLLPLLKKRPAPR